MVTENQVSRRRIRTSSRCVAHSKEDKIILNIRVDGFEFNDEIQMDEFRKNFRTALKKVRGNG